MLDHAEKLKLFIDTFIYEIGLSEKNLKKCCKIDLLKLNDAEWDQVSVMLDILGHADHEQQAFSSENEPSFINCLKGDIVEALPQLDMEKEECIKGFAVGEDHSVLVADELKWIVLDDGANDEEWEDVTVL
ncbi:hypothetical protein BT96DRAFT_1008137 [Gymnopus androsaceus JB14]|uniref:Uncharacterized protein n=1 Tax=Gymnopus androsaceus JB14 TaxID=1447944 RepID=A0A6A4GFX9_9AGAR|nr:hypothetical protein BT96DRAFT_1008137 [Gymnopus androsaceus JB14]